MSDPVFQKLDQCQAFPYPFSLYVKRFLWQWIQRTLFRFSISRAYRFRTALLKAFGAKLTATSRVRPTAKIQHPWLLEMGEHSIIADDVRVYNLGPVTIGNHSVISQNVHLCAGTHDYTKPDLPLQRPPINIGSGVWICVDAFIGPNVNIGDNTIVGARSVVVHDIPPNVIAAGNPAKTIKPRPMNNT